MKAITRSADIKQELLIVKDKVVPPHATKALGGRGCIASTHFRPRH
jgi:hypothetical protein